MLEPLDQGTGEKISPYYLPYTDKLLLIQQHKLKLLSRNNCSQFNMNGISMDAHPMHPDDRVLLSVKRNDLVLILTYVNWIEVI